MTEQAVVKLEEANRLAHLPAVANQVTAEQYTLIKKTIAQGATADELDLFLYDCKRQGVHPMDKLIHFTKRGGRYTPITSIDFMRMRAADTGELAGNDDPVFTFLDDESVIPRTASVTVWRLTQGQRYGYTATARWSEYKPPSGQDHMWQKMPQLMLGKCAEALALRKAFPKQLHGLYERAELEQAGKEDTGAAPTKAHTSPSPSGSALSAELPARTPDPEDHRQESAVLFPTPEEDNERAGLLLEISEVIQWAKREKKVTPKDINDWKATYLGSPIANPQTVDIVALRDLRGYLKNRYPQAPWRKE